MFSSHFNPCFTVKVFKFSSTIGIFSESSIKNVAIKPEFCIFNRLKRSQ